MSNTLLGLVIVAMAVVSVRQIVRHDIDWRRPADCREAARRSCRGFMKYVFFAAFAFMANVALIFFLDAATNIEVSAAQSRDINKPCIFLSTFDNHDVWHMLSAVGLA